MIQSENINMDEIKSDGWPVFFQKNLLLVTRLLWISAIIAGAPLVLIIVLIRPLVWLRFGVIDGKRIGHFTGEVEAYLCLRDKGQSGRLIVDIVGCVEPVCNKQLFSMWRRAMRITPGWKLWRFFDRTCSFWTRGDSHHVRAYGVGSAYRLLSDTKPHLRFTSEEVQTGRDLLRQLGMPPDARWICIHNRDAAYLDKARPGERWAYHNYRDFSIQSMAQAAEELVERGYYVLRMGSVVAEKFQSTNSKIIDYASSGLRSDFADIYLGAECTAYIGSDSGIASVPLIFRKPICYVNFSESLIGLIVVQNCSFLFITKRLWNRERKRFMSLRETFEIGLAGATESDRFEDVGVEPICNTSDEILDLSTEVDERLKGRWQPQPGDEELQRKFWEVYAQHSRTICKGDNKVRVGAAFLRKHADLLS